MSRFLSRKFEQIVPYTPGEQLQDMQYIKLNTNESPYPPSPKAMKIVNGETLENLRLYSDPESRQLAKTIADYYGVEKEQILVGNGSDELLAFAFQAFHNETQPICFPEITYGFYKVFAELYGVPAVKIPLVQDFQINIKDYLACGRNIILANPNAPTGICLPLTDIEKILQTNPENLVIIDEAYIDFGGESCIPLLKRYDNLLVIQTFSKSRSLAGARIGFALSRKEIIEDLNKIKFSFNPYNVNRLSMRLGQEAIADKEYFRQCTDAIIHTREKLTMGLKTLGFEVLPSKANFIFARHPQIDGAVYFKELKRNGILVRHWNDVRISDFVRVTIGTYEQMTRFYEVTKEILESAQKG